MTAGSVPARRRLTPVGLGVAVATATAAMVGAPIVPALAAYDVDMMTTRHPHWVIGVNDSVGGCLATGTVQSGTRVSFGRAAPGARPFLALANPKWASLVADDTYELTFVFDRGRAWTYVGTGIVVDAGPGVTVRGLPPAFIDAFARSNGLRVLFEGRQVDHVPLSGTRAATRAVQACQRHRIRPVDPFATATGTAAPPDGPPSDPFAVAVAPRDPFVTPDTGGAATPAIDDVSRPLAGTPPGDDGLIPIEDLDPVALQGWWREVGRAEACDAQASRAVIAVGRWVEIDGVPAFDGDAEWRIGLNGFDCMLTRGAETESGYAFAARCNDEDSPVYSQAQTIVLDRQGDSDAFVLSVGGLPFGLYVPCESDGPTGPEETVEDATALDPTNADGSGEAGSGRDDTKIGKGAH